MMATMLHQTKRWALIIHCKKNKRPVDDHNKGQDYMGEPIDPRLLNSYPIYFGKSTTKVAPRIKILLFYLIFFIRGQHVPSPKPQNSYRVVSRSQRLYRITAGHRSSSWRVCRMSILESLNIETINKRKDLQ